MGEEVANCFSVRAGDACKSGLARWGVFVHPHIDGADGNFMFACGVVVAVGVNRVCFNSDAWVGWVGWCGYPCVVCASRVLSSHVVLLGFRLLCVMLWVQGALVLGCGGSIWKGFRQLAGVGLVGCLPWCAPMSSKGRALVSICLARSFGFALWFGIGWDGVFCVGGVWGVLLLGVVGGRGWRGGFVLSQSGGDEVCDAALGRRY